MATPIKFTVTGASGYVGGAIAAYLSSRNHPVSRLTRSSGFQLGKAVPPEFFKYTDVLVHCAYDFSPVHWKDIHRLNVEGSLALMRSAKDGGVKKIIFISSFSAFENCRSLYGKAKLLAEKGALAMGAAAIRPGVVYGERAGGIYGTLQKAVSILPVLPLIGKGDQRLFMAHQDDLCALVLRISQNENGFPSLTLAANVRSVTFVQILKALCRQKNKEGIFLPLPTGMIWGLLKSAESVGLKPGFRSDSLVSLTHSNPRPDFDSSKNSGVDFRPFSV